MEKDISILLVDDDPHMLKGHARLLRSAGYRVIEAAGGGECLQRAREHLPGLVLLDVNLPDMDGREVCRHIKADPGSCFVVHMSAISTSDSSVAQGVDAGADSYICLPVSGSELLARVKAFMRIVRAEQALQEARAGLERKVAERTAHLRQANEKLQEEICVRRRTEQALKDREHELAEKNLSMQEVNTALKVLLDSREEEKKLFQQNILNNIAKLVKPHLETLRLTHLDGRQQGLLEIIESNLDDIVSPFMRRLSAAVPKLSPAELRLADYIRDGKTSKEIADLMGLSKHTLDSYRKNIRRKLGLTHKKENLQTYLLSLN